MRFPNNYYNVSNIYQVKILFINPHSLRNWGGNENWVTRMAELLQARGIEVEVISLDKTPGDINRVDNEFIKSKIKFKYTELKSKGGRYTPLHASRIPEINADVIYTTVPYYGFLRQISKIDLPKVWGFHDPSLQNPSNFLQRSVLSKLLPRFDMLHLLSSVQLDQVKNIKNVRVLESTWIYEMPECANKYEKFTVMFYGRHETDKGIETLLKVKSEIGDDVKFIVAGSGPRTKDLENKFSESELVGFVSDEELINYVKQSHVTLFPSQSESTTSLVAMESLANCTPILYRDIPVNKTLGTFDMNIRCHNDEDFIRGIEKLRHLYESDREKYMEQCRKLQSKMVGYKEYLDIFINDIITPAIKNHG